jgi:ankyrin repeat protein
MAGKVLALTFCALLSRVCAQAPLTDAAQQGDQAMVRQLLQHKANVNAAQPDGMTALHWAATRDDVPLAKMLLAAGAQTSPKTRLGELTPLFIASKRGSAPMIEALLKAGVNANATDSTGATPLMLASAAGSAEAVEMLLAHQVGVNAKESAHQQTALMFAAAADRGAVIRALIKHGADPEIATITSEPRCGSLFANSFCREAALGKDKPAPENVTQENDGEDQPPSESTTAKATPTTPPRRRKGPAIIGGMTALLYAARDGRTEAVRALIDAGAKIDNPGTGEKMTPLVMAVVNGHYDLAMYLLNSGANPNLAGDQGLTPLYATLDEEWAPYAYRPQPIAGRAEVSYLELMTALLAYGANPNATLTLKPWFRSLPEDRSWVDPTGATAFWRAAQSLDLEAMSLLIKAGADPKLASADGVTPLMVASGLGWAPNFSRNAPNAWLPAAKYCLELGISPAAKSGKGYTALHGAAFLGNNELIEELIAHGADVRAVANDKNTVADMANGPFPHSILHPDTVALVEKLGSGNSKTCRADSCVVPAAPTRKKPDQPKL